MKNGGVVVPILRYDDAPAAIDWLCKAFGFQKHLVVADEKDSKIIHHAQLIYQSGAQLIYQSGMIMLSSPGITDFDRLLGKDPKQNIYMIVPSADEHYARAKKSGAEILMDIKDQDYGGRAYTCRDLEGNIWSFGDYSPWKSEN